MSAGYGRGYYGEQQLARAPRRRGSGWVKFALVVGVGTVIWLMWPRSKPFDPKYGGYDPKALPPPMPPSPEGQLAQTSGFPPPQALPAPVAPPVQHAQFAAVAPPVQHAQFAPPVQPRAYLPASSASASVAQPSQPSQFHGYASTKEYEDAVVASAKQLKDSGAQVMLAPHLAHLAPRLGP